jgi:hypothetical protein
MSNKFAEVFGAKGIAVQARDTVLREQALAEAKGDLKKAAASYFSKILSEPRPREIGTLICLERLAAITGQDVGGHLAVDTQTKSAAHASEIGSEGHDQCDAQGQIASAAECELGTADHIGIDHQTRRVDGSHFTTDEISKAGFILRTARPQQPRRLTVADVAATGLYVSRLDSGIDVVQETVGETERRFHGSFYDQAMRYQLLNYCQVTDKSVKWIDIVPPEVVREFEKTARAYQEHVRRGFEMSVREFIETRKATLELTYA